MTEPDQILPRKKFSEKTSNFLLLNFFTMFFDLDTSHLNEFMSEDEPVKTELALISTSSHISATLLGIQGEISGTL